jgi:drug/metabolite transporter (DMT)-like permease
VTSQETGLSAPNWLRRTTASTIGLGIAMMLLGDFLFAVNDIVGKWLVATYAAGQVLLVRSIAPLIVLLPFVIRDGGRSLFVLERPRLQLARVVTATAELLFFYTAVAYLPLADVMTFYLAGPIYVAAVSPWLLGERVDRRQWLAIAAGFAGVVIVLAPSGGVFGWPSLVSLAGALCYAMMVVQSRQLRGTPDKVLVFWQTIGALIGGLVTGPAHWLTPTLVDAGLLAMLGVVAMLAHVCIARSLKLAPAAVVAPIQYSLLLWGILFGYLVFGDRPRPMMLIGAAIIIAAGLALYRVGRRPAVVEPAEVG